jgi:hypothetical protein
VIRGLAAGAVVAAVLALAGCMSGRVLRGYPGYPFARFSTSAPADSTFFLLQPAVEEEGFPLDYTLRDEGYIATRASEVAGRPVLLNLVVERASTGTDGTPDDGRTVVWIAAFEETLAGAERVNPLEEEVWREVLEIAARLSAAVDGDVPEGPSPSDVSGG